MQRDDLQQRTKQLALRIIKLIDALPKSIAGQAIGRQLIRSATSVGANYRASRRARSRKEFAAKLGVVVEEIDETCYWLELIMESEMLARDRLNPLLEEAGELTKIYAKARHSTQTPGNPETPRT